MTTVIVPTDLASRLTRLAELREQVKVAEAEIEQVKPGLVAELARYDAEVQLPDIGQRANLITPNEIVIPDFTRFYKLATRTVWNAATKRVAQGSNLRGLYEANMLGKAKAAVEVRDGTPYVRFDPLRG